MKDFLMKLLGYKYKIVVLHSNNIGAKYIECIAIKVAINFDSDMAAQNMHKASYILWDYASINVIYNKSSRGLNRQYSNRHLKMCCYKKSIITYFNNL